jgi:hypothetical protein
MRFSRSLGALLVVLAVAGLLAWPQQASAQAGTAAAQPAAQAPSKHLAPGFTNLKVDDKLLLMPIDVELFSLGLGGISEPRADWTAQAEKFLTEAIRERKKAARITVVELGTADADELDELIGLQAAVAQSIALHQFADPMWALPTKGGRLDWSFGDAMRPLQAATGARYALFIYVRDSYATAERIAVSIALAAVGIGINPAGAQIGLASLVDLETGQVVWFNLLARAYGDLRQAKPARESVDALLTGFPGVQ